MDLGRLPDSEVLNKARQEKRIVLTFDLDFGDLMAAGKATLPSVIIFRLRDTRPIFVLSRLLDLLKDCQDELTTGAIVIVEDQRYRLRKLPI